MHCLEVIVARNTEQAAKEAALATERGDRATAAAIIAATPAAWIESTFHKFFRFYILQARGTAQKASN